MPLAKRPSAHALLAAAALGAAALGCDDAAAPVPPGESPLIALTPAEYNGTIRDLLDLPARGADWPPAPAIAGAAPDGESKQPFGGQVIEPPAWPWAFPPEATIDDFEGMAAGQVPSTYVVEEMQRAAVHFAAFALVSPTFFACEAWGSLPREEQAACGWTSVERFAQRAFRRPLTAAERARAQVFWEDNFEAAAPDEAIVLTVAGLLQTPQFLFRIEQGDLARAEGDAIPLTGWEMASRLSYFLWDSMPDDALFAAAESGALATRSGVASHARRMLADPRARNAVVRFHAQWLGTDKVSGIAPARKAYGPLFGIAAEPALDTTDDGVWPAILGPIRSSMEGETALFVERTVFDGAGTLTALLTDNHGYLSTATAPLYGAGVQILSGPTVAWDATYVAASFGTDDAIELFPAELPPNERAGVLTLPSVLAVGAYAVHPAPIRRGKRVLERIACESFGAPLPGAESAAPPDTLSATSTNRERTEEATSPPACQACHQSLNPPGLAFENYDAMGAYRTSDSGQPIDASGTLQLSGGESLVFNDAVDLAQKLSTSTQVRDCYVQKWASYATGVTLPRGDLSLLQLQADFRDRDSVLDLLVSIAGSDLMRYRRSAGAP